MRRMATRWTVLAALAFSMVVLTAQPAHAITVGNALDDLPHIENGITMLTFSKADCEAGLTVRYQITGVVATENLEVWVGETADCAQGAVRTDPSQVCYQLTGDTQQPIGLTGFEYTVDAGVIANAHPEITSCSDTANSRNLNVYLLINVNGASDAERSATIPVVLDFVGPAAPSITSAGANDATSVNVGFAEASGTNPFGFFVYCEQSSRIETGMGGGGSSASGGGNNTMGWETFQGPGGGMGGMGGMPGTGGTGGAGGTGGGTAGMGGQSSSSGGASGSGGGGTSTPPTGECMESPTNLVTGVIPTVPSCGEGTGTPILATGLTPGFAYWMGVSAVDAVGNPGPLSELECVAPSDVDDFWSDYLNNGGGAGGGCGCTVVGAPDREVVAWGALLALGAAALYRRRGSRRRG